MHWINLTKDEQISDINRLSQTRAQVIFKHSSRCSVSSIAKNRLERKEAPSHIDFYFLDLIKYRSLSDKIATDFDVFHESPQILIIKNAKCIYDESHNGIQMEEIIEQLN